MAAGERIEPSVSEPTAAAQKLAAAAAPSLWVQCDGLPKPESLAKQTAKAGLTILTGGFYGLTIEGGGEPAGGEQGVSACTQALADPVLDDGPAFFGAYRDQTHPPIAEFEHL